MATHQRNDDDPPPAASPPIELRILGTFELLDRRSGGLIPLPAAKLRALIAYLAAAPRLTDSRRRIAGLLWADSGERQARQSMRQLLSNFRRAVDPSAAAILSFDETDVGLDASSVTIDRTAFVQAGSSADIAELTGAADLYRGDFAAGLDIGETEFDAWLHAERLRMRETAIAQFDRLVRALVDVGRHDEALQRANRLAEIDPLREETHRLVIAEEAAVSGRASAMQRFETFRILLRDELGVRPEPATLQLLERLRQLEMRDARPADSPPPVAIKAATGAAPAMPIAPLRRWRRPALAASLAAAVLLGGMAATEAWRRFAAPIVRDAGNRAAITLLPFDIDAGLDGLRARAGAYEAETKAVFAHERRFSLTAPPATLPTRDPIRLGRILPVGYVVMVSVAATAGGARADVKVCETAAGVCFSMASTPFVDDEVKFAHELYGLVFPAIARRQAESLAAAEPDSVPALLWRAAAAETVAGVAMADPPEFATYETALARDPNQLDALIGLANGLILKVARDQSKGEKRTEDLNLAMRLLARAESKAPDLPEIAFLEGMIDKLQQKYEEASALFERVRKTDPTNWTAAAEAAHVKLFLGRFDEAYAQMEAIPDIDAADAAFIAGETALMAGPLDRALVYYDMAVSHNPTISRNHAWRAVALWRAGRRHEAHEAALRSQDLKPAYLPLWMGSRAQLADKRYRDARDRCVQDFNAALAYTAPS